MISSLLSWVENKKNDWLILLAIFVFGLGIRFLYFPHNIYFGYDQARDAFIAREILEGNLKIVGPSSSEEGLSHGPLYFYFYAPWYWLFRGDPVGVAIFLRILNALGILMTYKIAKGLFGRGVGLIAALGFAVSYEQSQFGLDFGNPAFGVITVLGFYWSLSRLLFDKDKNALIWVALFWGLSIQFEVGLLLLGAILVTALVYFRKQIEWSWKTTIASIVVLVVTMSSFVLAEVVFGFPLINRLTHGSGLSVGSQAPWSARIGNLVFIAIRFVEDNVYGIQSWARWGGLVMLIFWVDYLLKKETREKMMFLGLWFMGGLLPYAITNNSLYIYGIAGSVSLIIFVAFLLERCWERSRILVVIAGILVMLANLGKVKTNNYKGPNPEINVQVGMLLADEERAIDFVYERAHGRDFAVNALTMPYQVNTTWSYLFEWYGQDKHGYMPVWGGDAAGGYPGSLRVEKGRSNLPNTRFLIVEPVRGIPDNLVNEFLRVEGYFANTLEEAKFGEIKVLVQERR